MTTRIMRFVLTRVMLFPLMLVSMMLVLLMASSAAAASWQVQLANDLAAADRDFSGDLSVYVKDIGSGEEVTLRADAHWYLASTIKVPVAVALYSRIEDGTLTLNDGVTREELGQPDMDSAFEAYYATEYNSGTMRGMGQYLEKLAMGELLSEGYTAKLLDTMESITTGRNRLQATLPEGVRFAHKTGTQHRRACDVGIEWAEPNRERPVIVATCARGPLSTAESEAAIRAVGAAVTRSGVLG